MVRICIYTYSNHSLITVLHTEYTVCSIIYFNMHSFVVSISLHWVAITVILVNCLNLKEEDGASMMILAFVYHL